MDIVRKILLAVEGSEGNVDANAVDEHSGAYHAAIMLDAGLIEAVVANDSSGVPIHSVILRMTWAGHEFLDASRDPGIWGRAKTHILKPGIAFTFETLKAWLSQEAMKQLGHLGA